MIQPEIVQFLIHHINIKANYIPLKKGKYSHIGANKFRFTKNYGNINNFNKKKNT